MRPGHYGAAPGTNLVQVLAIAGGLSPRADLHKVAVFGTDAAGGNFRVKVDLRREMNNGGRGPQIRPGDTVVVGSRRIKQRRGRRGLSSARRSRSPRTS